MNQTKETNSSVDIGFHFVATANQTVLSPKNSDDNGTATDFLPDYLEDTNGNGVKDGLETDWQVADIDLDSLNDFDEILYGTNPNVKDTDGDGIQDADEVFQGTDPTDANHNSPRLLGEWRFNVAGSLTNEQGVVPISGGSTPLTSSYERWAVVFGSTVAPGNVLRYPVTNSAPLGTNFNLRWGTVHFYYSPNWYLGYATNAPGQWCRLLECGPWQLSVTPDGNWLVFQSPAADGTVNRNFTAALPRSTATPSLHTAWEIQLQWCRAFTRISINGVNTTDYYSGGIDGSGLETLPSPSAIANGFCLGSSLDGSAGALGYIDQLTSYNAPFETEQFANIGLPRTIAFGSYADFPSRRSQFLSATSINTGLELHWLRGWEGDPAANTGNYNIERQVLGSSTWTVVASNQFTDIWQDTSVAAGTIYTYRIPRSTGLAPTVLAAWKAAPIESRGKAILLVDRTLTNGLSTDLATFKDDLLGDGWQVVRYDVPRHTNTFWDSAAINTTYLNDLLSIKRSISNEYLLNPTGTNVIIIVGHVTVPYSGTEAEDGHDLHSGAWPADAWYGDFDGQWGDSVNWPAGGKAVLQNVPGDGKWDLNDTTIGITNIILELAVGRIDFDNMLFFTNSAVSWTNNATVELGLLKRYFAKDHAYRRGDYVFSPSLRVFAENITFSQSSTEARSASAQFFGTDITDKANSVAFTGYPASRPNTLLAFHGGYGANFDSIESFGGFTIGANYFPVYSWAGDFAFGILSGSHFPDWNSIRQDDGNPTHSNFLRSCLAQENNGLAVMSLVQIGDDKLDDP